MRMKQAGWMLAAALCAAALTTGLRAQTARQDPDVLNALLTEVRGLRAAMEDMAVAGARVQLSLGRLQLQEQRVNTIVRRLESIRDEMAKAEKELATQQGQLDGFQKMFKSDATPDDRNPFAQMTEAFRQSIAAGTLNVQRLQAEEAQLQQQVSAEQARWIEFNRSMEDLEKALAKRSR
jgi:hypothetical protein